MLRFPKKSLLAGFCVSALAACSSTPKDTVQSLGIQCLNPTKSETSEMSVSGLTLVGTSVADAEFGTSAAEIVSYDSCTDALYVVNAQASQVDVLSLDSDSKPSAKGAIDLQSAAKHAGIAIGAANSVATHQGLVAVAIENANKQEPGIIGLYRSDTLELITTYPAGSLPDMVGISKDGRYIATANEGEPSNDFTVDPEGSVTLVDLAKGPFGANVTQIYFRDFNSNGSRHGELTNKVRISTPNATVAQDLEPEYLTFAPNGKIYVALQENNALAAIDVENARVDAIYGLGGKSWSNAELDASNKDGKVGNFKSYPMLEGLYMPDTVASYSVEGKTYILTANEGDGREYGIKTTQNVCDAKGFKWDEDDFTDKAEYTTEKGFCIAYVDEVRGKKLKVADNHPLKAALKDKKALGRLKVIKPNKPIPADQPVYAFGSRSFSIWDENGNLMYDSGDQFGKIAFHSEGENFNSTNDNNQSGDDRSDDKGTDRKQLKSLISTAATMPLSASNVREES